MSPSDDLRRTTPRGPGRVAVAPTKPSSELRFLGPTELIVEEARVSLGGQKQRAVLAVMSLRPSAVVTLDELVDSVWGDRPPPSAVNSAQTYVSRLRRAMADASGFELSSRGGGYALDCEPGGIDIHRFTRIAREANLANAEVASRSLREALDLWRGRALSDFVGWSFAGPQIARLEELHLVVTEQLVNAQLELGRHVELVAELEVLVGLHPLRESLWSSLMLALYRSGRQADALRAYQRVRGALGEQLGIVPGAVLQQLEGAILRQDPELAAVPRTLPTPRGLEDGGDSRSHEVLVGRRSELDNVDAWLTAAAAGDGRLVLVAGEAGIGKSALAREAMARARGDGMKVACGRVWEEEGAPAYWPWIEVLRTLHKDRHDDGAANRVTPDVLEALVGGTSPSRDRMSSGHAATAERLRLFESVLDEVLEAARHSPLLIVIEDLHVADIASINLLLFVARHVARARVLLVGTYRPSDIITSELGPAIAQLMREPNAHRIELGRLSDADVARLLRLRLGRDIPADLLLAIQRKAEGHPFFLAELVHLLTARSGGIELVDLLQFEVPHGVQQLVASRLAMVSEQAAGILRLAAVVGREVPLRLVQQIATEPPNAVVEAFEEGASAHLVTELTGRTIGYRFDHILVRDALYQELGQTDRRRHHERIADALEDGAAGPPVEHVSEIAQHRVASLDESNRDATVAALRRAARSAVDHLAFEQGVQLYELAIATIERLHGEQSVLRATLYELADAQQRLGNVAGARQNFLASADLARRSGDIDLVARIALGLGRGFEAQMFDGELVALLEEALSGLPGHLVAWRARLLARLAMAAYFEAGERREQLSTEALRQARCTGDAQLIAEALGARSFALWGAGHSDERFEMATSMLRIATETGNDDLALDALTWMTMEQLERGDRRAFDETSSRHSRLADRHRDPLHRYYAEMWRGMVAAIEGRYGDAESCADQAFQLGSTLTEVAFPRRYALLFAIRREQDRLADVADAADRVVVSYPLLRQGWEPLRSLVRAEMGDQAPALRLLDDLVTSADRMVAHDANWMSAMLFLAEACELVGSASHARVLYDRLTLYADRCAIVRFAPACWGSVSRSLGTLAHRFGDLASAVGHLDDAIDRNDRLGAPTWAARSRFDLARVLLARNQGTDLTRAQALLDSAGLTARQLGMTRLARSVASIRPTNAPSASADRSTIADPRND